MRIARRKQTRGGGIPFPKPFKLVLRAGFFMVSTIKFIARFPLKQDVAINSWTYSWQNLLYHCLYLSFLCFWLICLNFEIIKNIYYCEINGYCIASIVYEFRGDVFFLLQKRIGKNIKVIVKIAITRVLSSRGPLCQIFLFYSIYRPPCVHAASLGTTTHGCALTRPSLCRLSRQWGTGTGSDIVERDPSLLSLSILCAACVDVPDVPQQLTDLTSVV